MLGMILFSIGCAQLCVEFANTLCMYKCLHDGLCLHILNLELLTDLRL